MRSQPRSRAVCTSLLQLLTQWVSLCIRFVYSQQMSPKIWPITARPSPTLSPPLQHIWKELQIKYLVQAMLDSSLQQNEAYTGRQGSDHQRYFFSNYLVTSKLTYPLITLLWINRLGTLMLLCSTITTVRHISDNTNSSVWVRHVSSFTAGHCNPSSPAAELPFSFDRNPQLLRNPAVILIHTHFHPQWLSHDICVSCDSNVISSVLSPKWLEYGSMEDHK